MTLSKKYIIRLDDACPTMNRKNWERIEHILDACNIKPIVAVIPDNTMKELHIDDVDMNFWKRVKRWQDKAWYIALHGCNHTYLENPGKPLIHFNNYSEFAGLPYSQQYEKIKKGLEFFSSHAISTEIWVAPAHSFDKNTLKALKEAGKFRVISDGISRYPFNKYGFFWIPQQLWAFLPKKYGIWTVCLHPNTMSEKQFEALSDFCQSHACECVNDIESIKEEYRHRKRSILDILYAIRFFRNYPVPHRGLSQR